MKKLVSILSSAAILSSLLAVPVSADYDAAEYDVERYSFTFDDGAAENTIDGSAAKQFDDEDIFGGDANNKGYLLSDFFLSYDFNYYTDEDGNVPGTISFKNPSGDVGPIISYDADGSKKNKGQLVTQTASSSWQAWGAIEADTWYTIEFEGKFKARVDVRLYKYEDGVKTLVKETPDVNLRNFSASSNKNNISILQAYKVQIDNVTLVSTHPNEATITTVTDEYELRAGSSVPLSYELTRNGKAVTNAYNVSLSVYDENNENEITDGSVSLTTDNILVSSIESPDQTITVRATVDVNGQELIGTRQIKINSVSTDGELFDAVIVTGPDTVKAGTTAEYSFKATKNGVDVTDSLSDSDFAWSIYSTDDMNQNNSNKISLTGGKTAELTIDDSAIAQKMNVRLSTASGLVYGSKTVNVEFSDSQKETVLAYNACEDPLASVSRVESIDGSSAYLANTTTNISLGSKHSDYVLTEFDARFSAEGSNIYWLTGINGGEKWNTSFHLRGGDITTQSGSNNFPSLGLGITVTTEDWLHFEVLYSPGNASCIVTKYNADGTLGEPIKKLDIIRRQGEAYGSLDIGTGIIIDNIKISLPQANELTLTTPRESILAGEELQLTATISRNGLPINDASGLTWQLLDDEGLPIIDPDYPVQISDAGLLTTDPLADPQTVTVQVSSGAYSKTVDIEIKTSVIFEINNIGINEEQTKITKLYVTKNFNYFDEVTFIIAIHNAEGVLTGVAVRSMYGDALTLGSNELTLDLNLPADFNSETDEISVMTWTTF